MRLMPKQVQWNKCFVFGWGFFFGRKLWEVLCFESAMRSSDSSLAYEWTITLHCFMCFPYHFFAVLFSLLFFPALIHFIHVYFSGKFQFKWQRFIWARVLFTATTVCSFIRSSCIRSTAAAAAAATVWHTRLYLGISEIKIESLDTQLSAL